MNVLVLILQTIRPHSDHGGSSKHVKDVCTDLARAGDNVSILCGRERDNHRRFTLAEGVTVRPELPFRESWQDTWLVPPIDLAAIITRVMAASSDADRIVVFDSHLPYSDILPADVPVIYSLRDFVYTQALQGSLGFRRDVMVVPSQFVRDAYCDTVGQWLPDIADRMVTVRNGVDLVLFRPSNRQSACRQLGIIGDPILLAPHRPDDAKGFGEAIALCRSVADHHPDTVLVVPRGVDAANRPEVARWYQRLERLAHQAGIATRLQLIDWLPQERMPLLYNAANLTLCLGDVVEAANNVALESLACGTPVLASDIACYREYPATVHRVAIGARDDAAATAVRLLSQPPDRAVMRASVQEHHDQERALAEWRSVVGGTIARDPIVPRLQPDHDLKIPAWVSQQGVRLYDEYRKAFIDDDLLDRLWDQHGHRSFRSVASEVGGLRAIDQLLSAGGVIKTAVRRHR